MSYHSTDSKFVRFVRERATVACLALPCGVLLGCQDTALRPVQGSLRLKPDHVQFSQTWVGTESVREVRLSNQGFAPMTIEISTAPPFFVDHAEQTLAGGSTEVLGIRFAPVAPGSYAGTLRLGGSDGHSVALTGEALPLPDCTASDACVTARFDPSQGACITDPAPDGTPCPSLCLEDARCVSGRCMGQPIDCSDRNPCTLDGCSADSGCTHVDDPVAVCPPVEDPCLVPICDSATGCSVVHAPDGTACGPADCSDRKICLAGSCQRVSMPEGAPCGGLCGPGVCEDGACREPADARLTRLAHWVAPEGTRIEDALRVDGQGNAWIFLCHWPRGPDCSLVSFDPLGRERFSLPLPLPASQTGFGWQDLQLALHDGVALWWGPRGAITAYGVDNGDMLSTFAPAAGLPANTRVDGIAVTADDRLAVTMKSVGTRWLRSFSLDGTLAWTSSWPDWSTENGFPNELAIDERGQIVVGGGFFQRVSSFTPDGHLSWEAEGAGGLLAAEGGAVMMKDIVLSSLDGSPLPLPDNVDACSRRDMLTSLRGTRFEFCTAALQAVDSQTGERAWMRAVAELAPAGISSPTALAAFLSDAPSLLVIVSEVGRGSIGPSSRVSELSLDDGRTKRTCLMDEPDAPFESRVVANERLYATTSEELLIYALPGVRESPHGWSSRDADAQGTRRAR